MWTPPYPPFTDLVLMPIKLRGGPIARLGSAPLPYPATRSSFHGSQAWTADSVGIFGRRAKRRRVGFVAASVRPRSFADSPASSAAGPRPRQHSRLGHGHGGPRAWRPVRLPVREPRPVQRDRAAAARRDARVLLLHLHGLVERPVRRHRGRHGVLRVRAARHPEQSQLHPVRTCCCHCRPRLEIC